MSQTIAQEPQGCILIVFLHSSGSDTHDDVVRNIHHWFSTLRTQVRALHVCRPAGNKGTQDEEERTVHELYRIATAEEAGMPTTRTTPEEGTTRTTPDGRTGTNDTPQPRRRGVRIHTGSYQECMNSLKTFGIPVERLVQQVLLKMKNLSRFAAVELQHHQKQYHRRWIHMQQALEAEIRKEGAKQALLALLHAQQHQPHLQSHLQVPTLPRSAIHDVEAYNIVRAKYIECALPADCLFGKGRPAMKHPGNMQCVVI